MKSLCELLDIYDLVYASRYCSAWNKGLLKELYRLCFKECNQNEEIHYHLVWSNNHVCEIYK